MTVVSGRDVAGSDRMYDVVDVCCWTGDCAVS